MQTAVQAAELQTATTPWTEDWLAVVIGLLIFVLSLGVLGGADAFYRGDIAKMIARYHERSGGLIRYDDPGFGDLS